MKLIRYIALVLAAVLALSAGPFASPAEADSALSGVRLDPNMEILDLDAAGVRDVDLEELAALIDALPALKEVRLFDASLSTEDQEWLFDRYYPKIFFGFTVRIGPHAIRTDQTAFSTLHYSSPTKDDPRHTSEELFALRMCTRLRALDIGHNYLTDLNFLNWLPDIEVLIISPNYGLEDIGPIANCKKLVYLECFNTPITDLSPLAGCTELRDLNLTRDGLITDITPIIGLPKLERVWWGYMFKFPPAQRKEMRAKHKGCRFSTVYDPTSGGWRHHKHFKELFDFFRTGVYVPFSD